MEKLTSKDLVVALFNNFLEEGNDPKITEFRKYMDLLVRDEVKPLTGRSGSRSASASVGDDWRAEQKARYSGRGAKWMSIDADKVMGTLDEFDSRGIDTADYRYWIDQVGYAWIRYVAPRVIRGNKVAAFEIRTLGSTIHQPKELYYHLDSELDELIHLNSTPYALNLEKGSAPKEEKIETIDEDINDQDENDDIVDDEEFSDI